MLPPDDTFGIGGKAIIETDAEQVNRPRTPAGGNGIVT